MTETRTSPLEQRLRKLREQGRAGLIPFVTAGYPSPQATVPLLQRLEKAGAVAVELGIPFSDPLADGPAIQKSSQIALGHGVNVASTLEWVAEFHHDSDFPIILMSYLNPILSFGLGRFATGCREAGVSAVILTDLPPEERPDVWQALEREGIDSVLLVAPTTEPRRRVQLAGRSRGFVYCLSRTGITGDASEFAGELDEIVAEVRRHTDCPVAVGFGVKDVARARRVAAIADGVIVGAALCEELDQSVGAGLESALGAAERFIRELADGVAEIQKDPTRRSPTR